MLIRLMTILTSLVIFSGSALSGDEELEKEINDSLKRNEAIIEQQEAPAGGEIIEQQQQILKTLKEVDLFENLRNAQELLRKMPDRSPAQKKFLRK